MEAIEKSGHSAKDRQMRLMHVVWSTLPCPEKLQVKIGTDVAASEFYSAEAKTYDLDFKNPSSPADACCNFVAG